MVPRVPRGSSLSMKSYVQYIARDVRWYIIVKPHVSYDGGVPVGGHAKVASQTEDGVAHVSYIYLMNTYINVYNDMYGVLGPPARRGFCCFLPLEP